MTFRVYLLPLIHIRRLRVLVDSGAEIDRRHKALCRDLALCNSDTRAGDALMCAAHVVYLRCGVAGMSSIMSINHVKYCKYHFHFCHAKLKTQVDF
jgi:hypothetical protein